MRHLLTFVIFLVTMSLTAQQKQIKKSARLFEKRQYEKCIQKSQKYLKKHRKNEDLQYYIVQSSIALYEEKTDQQKFYQIKKILRNWDKLQNYKSPEKDYEEIALIIQHLIYRALENPGVNKRNQIFLHEQLASEFNDTTDYFRSIHFSKHDNITTNKVVEEITDSLFFLTPKRKAIFQIAIKQIGVPYRYGGVDSTGFDCSGFTQFLFQRIGIELPHNAQLQSELGELISLEEAQTGDLIFFGERKILHAGMIYVNEQGEAELIHCVSRGVSHDSTADNNHLYWMNRPYKVKRLIQNNID